MVTEKDNYSISALCDLLLTLDTCLYRRVVCSPDGALVIAPTGIHRPPNAPKVAASGSKTDPTPPGTGNSYCTHVFARDNLASPCVSLVGLEEPSIAVRCCLRPYKLIPHSGESMIPGSYRFVFAVVTLSSVFVYDTQHTHPLAKFAGLHYAPINDAAWSEDGRVLTVCSSDGYLSFFRFEPGALGKHTFSPALFGSINSVNCTFLFQLKGSSWKTRWCRK